MLAAALAIAGVSAPGAAQQRLTQAEALQLAFPDPATVERVTVYLTPWQLDSARILAGTREELSARVITYYLARHAGRPVGVAFFDAHRVRTKREVVMVVVDSSGSVGRIELLAFQEPPEYRPREGWLAQFRGAALERPPSRRATVENMSGATLTSSAIQRAVRRVLALNAVLAPVSR